MDLNGMYQDSPKTVESLNLSATSFHSSNPQNIFCFTGFQNATTSPDSERPSHGEKRKSQLDPYFDLNSNVDVPPRKIYFSEAAMSDYFAQLNLKSYKPSDFSIDCCQSTSYVGPQPVQPIEDVELESKCVDDDIEEEVADPLTTSSEKSNLVLSNDLVEHLKSYKCDDPVDKIIRDLLSPKPELALVPYNPNILSPIYRNPGFHTSDVTGVIEQPVQSSVTVSSINDSSCVSMESECISPSPCFRDIPPADYIQNLAPDVTPWLNSQPSPNRSCFPVTSAPITPNIFSIPYSTPGPVAFQRLPVYRHLPPGRQFRYQYN